MAKLSKLVLILLENIAHLLVQNNNHTIQRILNGYHLKIYKLKNLFSDMQSSPAPPSAVAIYP